MNKQVTTKQTNTKVKKGKRKGFTLMEIIFVAVIIGVLAGLIIPKIIKNAELSQNSSALQSDSKTIYSSLKQYIADSKYYADTKNLNAEELSAYFPSAVEVKADANDANKMIITDTNYPDITYTVTTDPTSKKFTFNIDVTKAANGDDALGKTLANKAANTFAKYCSTVDSYSGGEDDGSWVGQVLNYQLK